MKFLFIVLALFLACLVISCKIDRENSETYFLTLDVARSNPKDTSYCFNSVYGQGRQPLTTNCFIKQNTVQLPLNIAQDSSIFIFQKGTRFDTLKTSYTRKYQLIGRKYYLVMYGYKIYSSTFDSLLTTCGPIDANLCSEQNDFKATLYF